MFCKKCGGQMKENAKWCPYCGQKAEVEDSSSTQPNEASISIEAVYESNTAQPQVQPQVSIQPQVQPQVNVQPQVQVQSQGHVQSQAQPQANVQPQVQAQPQGYVQPQGQPQVHTQPQYQMQPNLQAQQQQPYYQQTQTNQKMQTVRADLSFSKRGLWGIIGALLFMTSIISEVLVITFEYMEVASFSEAFHEVFQKPYIVMLCVAFVALLLVIFRCSKTVLLAILYYFYVYVDLIIQYTKQMDYYGKSMQIKLIITASVALLGLVFLFANVFLDKRKQLI